MPTGDTFRSKALVPLTATATGTNAATSATLAGVTERRIVVESISVSGDTACVVTIESPASTILWQIRLAGAFCLPGIGFPPGLYKGALGADVLVKISASTTHCEANIAGYTVQGVTSTVGA